MIFIEGPSCGNRNIGTQTHASGSSHDSVAVWPWMASLGFTGEGKSWNHDCAATLITEQHFLTAAHCISGK